MPRITRVYTRSGDAGETSLASGERVPKDGLRIQAAGTVDELNSSIGAVLAASPLEEVGAALSRVQNELFHLGSSLSFRSGGEEVSRLPHLGASHIDALEAFMDRLMESLEPLENFLLPGGSETASRLHIARAVCRRAERDLLALSRVEAVDARSAVYLNRLSDCLFVMARFENHQRGIADRLWDSRA